MKKFITRTLIVIVVLAAGFAIYRFNFRKSIPKDATQKEQLMAIMEQNDCMVCHSDDPKNEPFYANFPIIGKTVKEDMAKGLRYVNLQNVDFDKINESDLAKLEQAMLSGSMPLSKYKMMHWGTGFNSKEKSVIADYVQKTRAERFATGLAVAEFAGEPVQPMVEKIDTDPAKVALGFDLYHDGRLSADGTISCATCHPLDKGGVDGLRTSKGINDQLGGINAPTVYNAVFNHVQFWNGRAGDLAEQAAGPPENPIEMGTQTWDDIVARLNKDKALIARFKTMYAEGITRATVTDAIAEFEKTLITPDSPFDKYLKGDKTAITENQIRGYELFKAHDCATCHVGQALGGQSFETMGIAEDYHAVRKNERPDIAYNDDDKGLMGFTGKESDLHKYKVPILRNIALTAPYLHDGTVETLDEAVKVMIRFQTDAKYTQEEVDKIVDFLNALTGSHQYF